MTGKQVRELDRVIIRFAGDSGDGMQLTGDRFTAETASFGNDLATLPNFPAEIRAPAGTLPGVSSFQLHFADHDILTPGDAPNVLVAMNPAALKANIEDLPPGATVIVDRSDISTVFAATLLRHIEIPVALPAALNGDEAALHGGVGRVKIGRLRTAPAQALQRRRARHPTRNRRGQGAG